MILSYNKFLKFIVVFYVYAILFFPTFLVYICLILLFLLKNNDVVYDILLTNQVLPYNYFLISPRFIPSGTFFMYQNFLKNFLMHKNVPVLFQHRDVSFTYAVPLCFMNDLYRHACTHPALSCLFPLTAGDPSKPTQYHLLIHNASDSFSRQLQGEFTTSL